MALPYKTLYSLFSDTLIFPKKCFYGWQIGICWFRS